MEKYYNLYYLDGNFKYIINGISYNAESLIRRTREPYENTPWERVFPFSIEPRGSQILAVIDSDFDLRYMLFQEQDGQFIQLTPWDYLPFSHVQTQILRVPLPDGRDINGAFEEIRLRSINPTVIQGITNRTDKMTPNDILFTLNNPNIYSMEQGPPIANNQQFKQNLLNMAKVRPLTNWERQMLEHLK
jgi:hypothetical protein